jgi:esterase/lipase superfamily enzyme
MVPVSGSVPGAGRVDLLVATTRKRSDPTEMFSGDRGPTLALANVAVSIPSANTRKVGEVQWPRRVPGNPATEVGTLKVYVIDRPRALAWFHWTLRIVPRRQVLVFIHGFNNRFDDAVFRFAQIVHDSRAPVVPILLTWPSRGSVLGYDRQSAIYSRNALESLLKAISRDRSVGEISILAHSMGNSLALETLRAADGSEQAVPVIGPEGANLDAEPVAQGLGRRVVPHLQSRLPPTARCAVGRELRQ